MKSLVELLSQLWRILSFQRNGETVVVGGVGSIPIPVSKIENTTSTPKIENTTSTPKIENIPVPKIGKITVPKKRKKKHNHQTRQSKNKCLRKMTNESRRQNRPKK